MTSDTRTPESSTASPKSGAGESYQQLQEGSDEMPLSTDSGQEGEQGFVYVSDTSGDLSVTVTSQQVAIEAARQILRRLAKP